MLKQMLITMTIKNVVMPIVSKMLTTENYQAGGDKVFDLLEKWIKDTRTDLDDKTLLPLIAQVRAVMNIPDAPDGADLPAPDEAA